MIEEIYDFKDILSTDARFIFCDLEDTIFASNIYYNLIGHKNYCDVFVDLCKGVKIFDVSYLGKNYKRVLMQKDIPQIVSRLKKNGQYFFILTSGYPSMQKKMRVREKGIKVDGFLFTRGRPKGPFLKYFLDKNEIKSKVAFVDNHIEKINSVGETIGSDKVDLFLYKREFTHKVSMESFQCYWQEVVEQVKDGAIEKLKQKFKENKIRTLKNKNIEVVSKDDIESEIKNINDINE